MSKATDILFREAMRKNGRTWVLQIDWYQAAGHRTSHLRRSGGERYWGNSIELTVGETNRLQEIWPDNDCSEFGNPKYLGAVKILSLLTGDTEAEIRKQVKAMVKIDAERIENLRKRNLTTDCIDLLDNFEIERFHQLNNIPGTPELDRQIEDVELAIIALKEKLESMERMED